MYNINHLSFYIYCSNLRLQKRLSASVMKCGKRKVWLDPNEVNEIANANSSMYTCTSRWHSSWHCIANVQLCIYFQQGKTSGNWSRMVWSSRSPWLSTPELVFASTLKLVVKDVTLALVRGRVLLTPVCPRSSSGFAACVSSAVCWNVTGKPRKLTVTCTTTCTWSQRVSKQNHIVY